MFVELMSLIKTISQYDRATAKCREVFSQKTKDYGTSWRVLRASSLTDQLFIKAQRIRTIEETKVQKVNEGIEGEFIALVNYAIIGLIQLKMKSTDSLELGEAETLNLFDKEATAVKELMLNKNHDYGEAWRDMRISSFTDLILMKLLRIRQIEDNKGKTLISEGVEAGYSDIMNYAIFALIKLDEQNETR